MEKRFINKEVKESAMKKVHEVSLVILLLSLSLFHLYTAGFGCFGVMVQRGLPLMLACIAIFISKPLGGAPRKPWALVIDGLLIIGTILSIGYVVVFYEQIADRMGITTTPDIVACVIGIICLLEATRRSAGNSLVIICAIALAYVFLGPYMPGLLYHEGFGLERLARTQWTGLTGVFGTIMNIMVTVIFIFVLLSAFLRISKAGDYMINFALAVTGRMRGGPALSAVMASSLFGTVSGSPVANVLGTGTFTIPLIKKSGFEPKIAASVEAAASSGGYLMPPIMGAAAFIMAEFTGIPYLYIAIAAIVPSIIYYATIFIGVYTYAAKVGAAGLSAAKLPQVKQVLKDGFHVFLSFPILIAALIVGYTPSKSAFYTIVSLFILCMLRKNTRLDFKKTIDIFKDGAQKSLGVMTACASMGIIIGVMELTGLGVNMGFAIELMAAGHLLPCLILVMVASIIIGMGVAPVATYILLIIMIGPILNQLGLPLIVAHFFVLYFSTYATITPPVCLSAYAGAGIAGSDPFKTGVAAFRLGIAGFLVPFLLAYYPLLLTGSVQQRILYTLFGLLITIPLSIANFGYLFSTISNINRILIVTASFLISLKVISQYLFITGVLLLSSIMVFQFIQGRKVKAAEGQQLAV
jgi:TRAP transporter 4TM/12TM fusion protein